MNSTAERDDPSRLPHNMYRLVNGRIGISPKVALGLESLGWSNDEGTVEPSSLSHTRQVLLVGLCARVPGVGAELLLNQKQLETSVRTVSSLAGVGSRVGDTRMRTDERVAMACLRTARR